MNNFDKTAYWQDIDQAHHIHPFTDTADLNNRGTRVITRAEGVFIEDSNGKRYLDGMAGLWCVNVGYGRKELAEAAYKQMIVDGSAADIVYSDVFTGGLGNYLRPSIVAAGLDPDALPKAKDMDFASLTGGEKKAWRDVWGAGQGIGAIAKVQPAADFIAGLKAQYRAAVEGFTA